MSAALSPLVFRHSICFQLVPVPASKNKIKTQAVTGFVHLAAEAVWKGQKFHV